MVLEFISFILEFVINCTVFIWQVLLALQSAFVVQELSLKIIDN